MRIFLCYVKIKDKAVLGGMELKRKIAVIATEYIKEFLQSMLGDLDVDYCIFTYKTFSDIQYIYEKVTEEFDGILTSGSFPAPSVFSTLMRLPCTVYF